MNQEEHASETFIGEPVKPKPGSFDMAMMATGIPGLPREFAWRNKDYAVAEVLRMWKTTSPCTGGGDEMYVRRHYYRVLTTSGDVMVLYCDRHPPKGRSKTKGRWVLYALLREP